MAAYLNTARTAKPKKRIFSRRASIFRRVPELVCRYILRYHYGGDGSDDEPLSDSTECETWLNIIKSGKDYYELSRSA